MHTFAPWPAGPLTRRDLWTLLPIVALAVVIRGVTLTDMSLWMDELRQVSYYYENSFRDVMYYAATQQQPPLDYWIGHVIFKFVRSDAAARFPAMLFGTLLVPLSYCLARRMVGRLPAACVAVGLTFSPYAVFFSQEARPYAIFWFGLTLAMCALLRAWHRNHVFDWLLLFPCLLFCQMSRGLAPLMFTAALGIFAIRALCQSRATHAFSWSILCRLQAARLLACLVAVWIPFLYVLNMIMHFSRRKAYLSVHTDQGIDWTAKLSILVGMFTSVVDMMMPFGFLLLPLGAIGVVIALRRRQCAEHGNATLVMLPVLIGFGLHVITYTALVQKIPPRPAYVAYLLPVLLIGVACTLQMIANRLRARAPDRRPELWIAVPMLIVLSAQVMFDRSTVVMNKPDFRSATQLVADQLDEQSDVVFYTATTRFGEYHPALGAAPHYWPNEHHVIPLDEGLPHVLNDGRPILDRSHCRVALMVWSTPDTVAPPELPIETRSQFELHTFHRFWVIMSRDRFHTADDGLMAISKAYQGWLGSENPRTIEMACAEAMLHAKAGNHTRAGERLSKATRLVPAAMLADWSEHTLPIHQQLSAHRAPIR
jgi:hypothetical protein